MKNQIGYKEENEVLAYIDKYKDYLWAQAMDLTHKSEDAEDLYQETMLKVYRGWDSFEPDSNFRAWVGRIMLNTHINNCNRRRMSMSCDFSSGECANAYANNAEDSTKTYSGNPEKLFFDKYVDNRLVDSLASLPDSYKTPFTMYHLDGYSYEEIAGKLDLPIGTVKSRLFRAKQNLKTMINEIEGKVRLSA